MRVFIKIDENQKIIFYQFEENYQPEDTDILLENYKIPEDRKGFYYEEYYQDGKARTVYEPLPLSIEDQLAAAMEENKELKQRQDLAEEALLQLSDMILTK